MKILISFIYYFLITLWFVCCTLPTLGESSQIETEIYSCSLDPEVSELTFHAISLKNYVEANEIFLNLLKIRPNCIDVNQALAGNYALLNDMKNFQIYNNRAKFLKTEYDMKSGKLNDRIEKKLDKINKTGELKTEPPRSNYIDHMRWRYIYSRRYSNRPY